MKRLIMLMIVCLATQSSGCRNGSSAKNESENPGAELVDFDVAALQQRYREAKSYSDQAQLVLRYTLQGVPFEESHPFHSKFSRDGRGEILWFKHQTQSNGNVALTRILDLKTENFDGQVVVEPGSIDQVTVLLETRKINQHFLAGLDEVPWEIDHQRSELTRTIGLAYCLFYDWPSSWLTPEKLIKAIRVSVDEESFVDATFQSPWGQVLCRIDPDKLLITGVRFPQKLLSPQISASPEVKDVSLALLFNDAQLDAESQLDVDLKISDSEKPVSELITLPEAFPSEKIGQKMPEFRLQLPSGSPKTLATSGNSILVGFYGDLNQIPPDMKNQIEKWSDSSTVSWYWVQPTRPDKPTINFTVLVDSDHQVFKFFVPAKAPQFCFVLNKERIVQYFGSLNGDPTATMKKLKVAVHRVLSGDNLSREMHNEYARYYKEYRAKLTRVQPVQALLKSIQK